MSHPETRFAALDGHRVAWRMSGSGPCDVVASPGLFSHMEMIRGDAGHVAFRERMQTFCRHIGFDRLGTGVSDRPADDDRPAVEQWIASCAAVLDAAQAPRPVFLSLFSSGPLVLEFAERYPERCAGLIFVNSFACWAARPGYDAGAAPDEIARSRQFVAGSWGRTGFPLPHSPSQAGNTAFVEWNAAIQRAMATADEVLEGLRELAQMDARRVLAKVRVPTLVLARRGLAPGAYARSRYIAEHVAGARFIELPGADIAPFYETPDLVLDAIEEFVTKLSMQPPACSARTATGSFP